MGKILFLPLNTNHVLIFKEICRSLTCKHLMLCHDNISEAKQYRTKDLLENLGIEYELFKYSIPRSENENLIKKIRIFYRIKKAIIMTIQEYSPDVVVLGIDHDPIAQVVINEAKRLGYKSVLLQEGLITPHQYSSYKLNFSDFVYDILRVIGIYINYSRYGSGCWDKILVGGRIPYNILRNRGITEERIDIVGIPKYDSFFTRIKNISQMSVEKKVYLYAARPTIVSDKANVDFLNEIVNTAVKLQIHLIIKLHPRSTFGPDKIYDYIKSEKKYSIEIIKEGDDTFEILKKSYAIITDFSTVALEALIMDKECVVASYLAGDNRFEYDEYDAIFCIENEHEIYNVINASAATKKSKYNKLRLLEDELYKLDGQSGQRAARYIENMISRK